jgi:hypothetical protein
MSSDTIIKMFDSPTAFLEWASHAPLRWNQQNCESRRVDSERTAWTGTRNYDEAYDLAKLGWRDGLKLLTPQSRLADVALEAKPAAGRQKRHDIAGFYPNPARAAAGEIFSMVQPLRPKVNADGNLVKMRYDIGRASHVSTESIITMGAALCSYINMLETSGYVVQLDAFFEMEPSYGSGGPDVSFRFPLKKPGYNLAMADIVFWLAHPSALRRIEFSAMERLETERWYVHGYGRPACVTPVPADTLYLRIDDFGGDIGRCLETIRRKHLAVLTPGSRLAPQLQTYGFASK